MRRRPGTDCRMAHPDYPITPAVRFLRERGIEFKPHLTNMRSMAAPA